jgi:hypothetical protein
MKNTNKSKMKNTNMEGMSAREVMVILSNQMRSLAVKNGKQPSSEVIRAANARCNAAGKYLAKLRRKRRNN